MQRYKKSLQVMLEKESVGVLKYLKTNSLDPTPESIKTYYSSIKKTVNKNGIKQMVKYLSVTEAIIKVDGVVVGKMNSITLNEIDE